MTEFCFHGSTKSVSVTIMDGERKFEINAINYRIYESDRNVLMSCPIEVYPTDLHPIMLH